MATLNDIIRQEFKDKIKDEDFIKLTAESELDETILIDSIEALLPDKDWKEHKGDDKRLIKKNALKLINNLKGKINDED